MEAKRAQSPYRKPSLPLACFLFIAASAPMLPHDESASGDDSLQRDRGSQSGRFKTKIWTTDDGLPQSTITDIIQTRDGYLWLGTFAGLVRFDGVGFKVFDLVSTDGIVSNRVTALCEDNDGTLWFGTEEGTLTCYRNGRFTSFELPDKDLLITVTDLVPDGTGGVWIAAWNTFVHFANGKFQKISYEDGQKHLATFSVHIDSSGKLWVGTAGGLAVYENNRLKLRFSGPGVRSINEDSEGRLWFSIGYQIGELHNGQLKRYTVPPVGVVKALHVGRVSNRRWIGSTGGLSIFGTGGSIVDNLRWSRDLHDRIISFRAIFEDREGNVWCGTNNGGLVRLNDRRVHRMIPNRNDFRTGSGMNALAVDADGTILVAAACGGVRRLVDGVFEPFPDFESFQVKGCIRSMTNDSHGALWIAHQRTISRRHKGVWTHYGKAEGLPGWAPSVMYESRDRSFWVGGHGLYRFEHDRFNMVPETNDAVEKILSIIDSADGSIWFGGWKGVGRYHDGRVSVYTSADGLGKGQVRAIYEDEHGVMWFGSYGGGITRLKNGRFTRITVDDGLFDNTVSKILPDDNGNLWMNSNHGIFAASLDELNAVADGTISEVHCQSVNSGEGNGASGLQTADGRMWFPTIEGVAVINPKDFVRNTVPPNVVIESIVADDMSMDIENEIQIPPGNRDLEIRYSGLSFAEPEKVRFKYRLHGYNKNWVDANTRRVAYFTNVPPGEYEFHVIACNNDGVWNETGTSLTMSLSPYFYETNWFATLCLLFVVGTAGFCYKLRTHSIRVRNQILQAEINERKLVEDALRKSECRYRAVVEDQTEFIVRWRPDGTQTFVNDAFCRFVRKTERECLGSSFFPIVSEEDRPAIASMIQSLTPERPTTTEEHRAAAQNGEIYWQQWTTRGVFDGNGDLVELLSVGRDITARKQAEETIRHIVDVIAPTTGQDFFHTLTTHLSQICRAKFAFVAEIDPNRPSRAKSIAVSYQGLLTDNFTYELQNTPCENVVGKPLCYYPTGVQHEFPKDTLLVEMGVDSYMGTTLFSNTGEPLGLIVLLHDRPIAQSEQAKAILQVVAARAGAELERNRTEAALRASETRYRTFVDHATDALFLHDHHGRVIDVNRQACESLGYQRDELIGMTPTEYDPDVTPTFLKAIRSRLTAGETIAFDSQHQRKDGSTFPVEIRIRPFLLNGQTYRLSLAHDITERKRAEEKLRESQQRLQLALTASRMGVWERDLETETIFWSPECSDIIGIEMSGERTDALINRVHPEDVDALRKADEQGVTEGVGYSAEFRFIRPDVQVRWLEIHCTMQHDEHGKPRKMVGNLRDITDLKQAAENMRQHQAVVAHAQRLSSVGEMVASLAHELHQPLGAIRNYASILQDHAQVEQKNGPLVEAASGAIEESKRANEIIKRLRNFMSKRELTRSIVDINEVVRDAVKLTAPEAAQSGVSVLTHLEEVIPAVRADSVQLEQVVVNLITNALDAMADLKHRPRRAEIRTRDLREHKRVQVAVSDNGTGIPLELRNEVFGSFFTTKPQGLGLGLTISRSIIEAHGGNLTMADGPKGGMTFVFEVPYERSQQQ